MLPFKLLLGEPVAAVAETRDLLLQALELPRPAVAIVLEAANVRLEPRTVVNHGVAYGAPGTVLIFAAFDRFTVGKLPLQPIRLRLAVVYENALGGAGPLPRSHTPPHRTLLAVPALGMTPAVDRLHGARAYVQLGHAVQHDRPRPVSGPLGFLPLHRKAAVIDAGGEAVTPQKLVLPSGKFSPPTLQQVVGVPFPRLGPVEALRGRLAQRKQHMGMMIARVVTALPDRRVNGEIRHHTPTDELLGHKAAHQLKALLVSQLMRQRHIDFAGELGVAALLAGLDVRPQLFAVLHPRRRGRRRHHLGMGHAALFAVIVNRAGAPVLQPRGRPVRGRRHHRVACAAFHDLCGQVITRQNSPFRNLKSHALRDLGAPMLPCNV